MGAIMSLCLAQLRSGDHIICSSDVFGSTVVLLNNFFAKFGVEISYVKLTDMAAWRAAIKDNTRFLFIETPSNPLSQVGDIAAFADLAHQHDLLLVVDNCFCSPALQNPLALGADIIIHSATKYIGGHGTSIGGVIVDGGDFDWEANPERQPKLNNPDPNYNGVVWTEAVKALHATKAPLDGR